MGRGRLIAACALAALTSCRAAVCRIRGGEVLHSTDYRCAVSEAPRARACEATVTAFVSYNDACCDKVERYLCWIDGRAWVDEWIEPWRP